jgi:hypothetical protein
MIKSKQHGASDCVATRRWHHMVKEEAREQAKEVKLGWEQLTLIVTNLIP